MSNAATQDVERVRAERQRDELAKAKEALLQAICIAGERDRDQAKRLIHLWAQVDEEIDR